MYDNIAGIVPDVEIVAERLGFDRFAVAGLSGGGAYTLAIAHHLADRVPAACVLGSVSPTYGKDAPPGGVVRLAHRFNRPLTALATPSAQWCGPRSTSPSRSMTRRSPSMRGSRPKDREILTDPEMKAMFLEDIQCRASASSRR